MRILYFADIRFPLERANGIQTMETVWHLADRGHDVTLVVRPDTARTARDPLSFYGLPAQSSLTVRYVAVFGPNAFRRAQYVAAALAATARPSRWDAILTRDLGVASAILGMPRRPPLVYESHGFAPAFAGSLQDLVTGARAAGLRKLRRLDAREGRVWRRAEGYVATTNALVRDLTDRFGARDRLAVIPNGVHLLSPRTFPDPAPRPSVVAYSGHLYPWKGVDTMLRALAAVPAVSGLVLGGYAGDSDDLRVRDLAASLGIADRVVFAGPVPTGEVVARLRHAAVLVLPTTATPSARYTSPLKMFEYMTAGRPMVASDLESVREILTDGVNARLVPPEDAGAFAAAIRDLIRDDATAVRLARRAFADVENYSWARRAERLERLMREATSRG